VSSISCAGFSLQRCCYCCMAPAGRGQTSKFRDRHTMNVVHKKYKGILVPFKPSRLYSSIHSTVQTVQINNVKLMEPFVPKTDHPCHASEFRQLVTVLVTKPYHEINQTSNKILLSTNKREIGPLHCKNADLLTSKVRTTHLLSSQCKGKQIK
jgi:hypothetical protein